MRNCASLSANVFLSILQHNYRVSIFFAFFSICEYLHITPVEFFDTENINPKKNTELLGLIKNLNSEDIDIIITLIKRLKK